MEAKDPVARLTGYVKLQKALWAKLQEAYGNPIAPEMAEVPRTGILEVDGQNWTFKKHGQGVLFAEENGKRRVDLYDGAGGVEHVDSWRLATYFGGLGREGDKLLTRAIGSVSGTVEQRVHLWLERLAAEGLLVADGSSYRFVGSCD